MSRTPSRARVARAVAWTVWHLIEIAGVAVPLVLAAVWSGWWALVSVLAGGCWVVHEWRTARTHRRRARRPAARLEAAADDQHGAPGPDPQEPGREVSA
jgi:hypothetical protein